MASSPACTALPTSVSVRSLRSIRRILPATIFATSIGTFTPEAKLYLKRYRGETNSSLTILLDASNSMQFGSHGVNKMDYARYLAASLFYLTIHEQRDAAGLITFDDEVRNYIRPPPVRASFIVSWPEGLEQAEARARTDFAKPMRYFWEVSETPRHRADRLRLQESPEHR